MDDRGPTGSSTAVAPPTAPDPTAAGPRASGAPSRHPWWAGAAIVVAGVAVIAGAVWGVRGLFGNPVRGTDAAGVTTVRGSWEPITCGSPCIGNVQDGGRSVTVILPSGCPEPAREAEVTVQGRLDTSQGSGTYRALRCATS